MMYYSELTKKAYNTEEECLKAEKAYASAEAEKRKKDEKRAVRAKEVEALYRKAREAEKAYSDALQAFVKDYGAFHMTFNGKNLYDDFANCAFNWLF